MTVAIIIYIAGAVLVIIPGLSRGITVNLIINALLWPILIPFMIICSIIAASRASRSGRNDY